MHSICNPILKKDHYEKVSGSAEYIADIKKPGLYAGRFVRSVKPRAKIKDIVVPELPEGYFLVDRNDAPGINRIKIIKNDQPIFAEDEVNYVGEAIVMIVGPDAGITAQLADKVKIEYEEETPVLDIEKAEEVFCSYGYTKGDPDTEFKNADRVVEESFFTGYQEQAYIEPQGIMGEYKNGRMIIHGTMQCPYYVKGAIQTAMGLDADHVEIVQTTTGGAFGGKEDYPSVLACQVAVAAYKCGHPVRIVFERREDMAVTTKRHPSLIKIKSAVNDCGEITAMDVDITFNAGGYEGLTSVVLQRGVLTSQNVYTIKNVRVNGRAVKTNTVPNGAFRGFGGPQAAFAMETHMDHIARILGRDEVEFKKGYFAAQGQSTPTGGKYYDRVPLLEMVEKAKQMSSYDEKLKEFKGDSGRYKRGIGMAMFMHGCGFTGSAERDLIKAVVRLVKHENGTVEILCSNTDMGQGIKTTLSKIVGSVLDISPEKVIYNNPDTDRVPDSGPTVASRSLMTVGKLLERAALKLKDSWKEGEYQCIEEHYVHPQHLIPWSLEEFHGDAYPTFSWGVNVVEVKVDTLTAITEITGAWGVFDVGTAADSRIMQGQMEGGMLQGLGYGSMENMTSVNGVIQQRSITDYIIPTAKDTPRIETALVDNPYEGGPYGAKGAGELTLVGAAPAYVAAVEKAVNINAHKIPLLPEDLMELM